MKKILLIILTTLLFFSCKHELEKPTWDVDLLVPLLHSQISINDLLTDSNTTLNEDSFITLVFQEKFTDINLDTLISVTDTIDKTKVVLDSIAFKEISITEIYRLSELLGDFGAFFPHMDTMIIPNLNIIPTLIPEKDIPVDASEYFESMTFHKGYLVIHIYNGFKTDLANIDISLSDASNNNIIASFNFPLIPYGSTANDSVFLGGMTIFLFFR